MYDKNHLNSKYPISSLLDAFANLRNGTISFVMTLLIRPSVRMKHLGSCRVDFYEI
jgi:hypothetical protein